MYGYIHTQTPIKNNSTVILNIVALYRNDTSIVSHGVANGLVDISSKCYHLSKPRWYSVCSPHFFLSYGVNLCFWSFSNILVRTWHRCQLAN